MPFFTSSDSPTVPPMGLVRGRRRVHGPGARDGRLVGARCGAAALAGRAEPVVLKGEKHLEDHPTE